MLRISPWLLISLLRLSLFVNDILWQDSFRSRTVYYVNEGPITQLEKLQSVLTYKLEILLSFSFGKKTCLSESVNQHVIRKEQFLDQVVQQCSSDSAHLDSTKPRLRFRAGSNPVCGVLEISSGENHWQWSWQEIRLVCYGLSVALFFICLVFGNGWVELLI